jgi:hypothetical protein
VLERRELLGRIRYHVNQVSFALACLAADVRVDHLPVEFNLPTHVPRLLPHLEGIDPRVLHFHDALEAGGLLKPTGVASIDDRIAAVNSVIGERHQEEFDRSLLRGVGSAQAGTKARRRMTGGMRRIRAALGG